MTKNLIKSMVIILAASILLTSCYSYTSIVGNGVQGNQETTEWNHYELII